MALQIFPHCMLVIKAKLQLFIFPFEIFVFFLCVLSTVIRIVETRTRIIIRLPSTNRCEVIL